MQLKFVEILRNVFIYNVAKLEETKVNIIKWPQEKKKEKETSPLVENKHSAITLVTQILVNYIPGK